METPAAKVSKLDLIEWIRNLDDELILKELGEFKRLFDEVEGWENVPESHKPSILKGLRDCAESRTVPASNLTKFFSDVRKQA